SARWRSSRQARPLQQPASAPAASTPSPSAPYHPRPPALGATHPPAGRPGAERGGTGVPLRQDALDPGFHFLAGLDLIEPGLVPVPCPQLDPDDADSGRNTDESCALARKTGP